jgi:hypothetical protein
MHDEHAPTAGAPNSSSRDVTETSTLPLVYCPECGMPAWVEWREAAGTAGPAYVKVRCFARHWFLLLEEPLTGRLIL